MSLDITGIGSIASLAETVIGKIWPPGADPNKKIEAQLELQKVMEAREIAVTEAQRSIVVAEMQQSDNFTKRARPMVIYAGLTFIFFNHVFLPCYAFFTSKTIPAVSLPSEFWWAWTGCVGIWMIGRTLEKRGVSGDILSAITGGK